MGKRRGSRGRPGFARTASGMLVLALASVALAGCLTPPPTPQPDARRAPEVPPALPGAVRPVLAAYQGGRALPLQGLVAHAEAFRGLPAVPATAPAPGDLADALLALLDLDGIAATPEALRQLAGLATLPRDLRGALAVLATATLQSAPMARQAFAGVDGPVTSETADTVDWSLALRALRLKLAAVEATLPVLRGYAGALATPAPGLDVCGSVALDLGSEGRRFTCNYTLLVDLGGDDVYLGNAGGTHHIYASPLHLDLAGDDQYLSQVVDHTGVTGGAVSGVGTLVDVQGDDTYDTTGREGSGQNGGVQGGVGFLGDLGGKDLVKATGMLHSGVNGAAWIGHGTLLLAGGDDAVEGWTEGAGALNGAGLLGTGLVLGLGGNRAYRAEDGGQPFGGTSNGAGVGGGLGTLVDHGGDTRYEAHMAGGRSSANGGGLAGTGALHDLGGGDDHYLVRGVLGSALNGGGAEGPGMLFDDGGKDTYDEGAAVATDATVVPKGMGAQVDGGGAKPAAEPRDRPALQPWPEVARPVARALARAAGEDFALASLHRLGWALAAMPGDAPRDALPAAEPLAALVASVLRAEGHALPPSALADLAALPRDLQDALALLLRAYLAASDLVAGAPQPEGEAPGPEALRARGLLLQAVEAARPTLAKYAGRPLAPEPLGYCGSMLLDLSSADATYTCPHAFQVTLGGDSTYRNNAGGSLRTRPGFLLDAAGDDRYEGHEGTPGYGVAGGASGVTALGFLADLQGDDQYLPACARGCSAMGGADAGTGALVDYAGDDHYMLEAGGLSAATGGAIVGRGFLADLAGDDIYLVSGPQHTAGNGGAIFGTGLLFDRAGDDLYHVATGEHGPGNGGAIIGSGILLDLEGDDQYHAEAGHHAMVNGAAFWATPGAFLIDGAGDDSYTAVSGMKPFANGRYWYPGECPAPRTGCTRGVAALVDLGGRDAYLEWDTGMGHGHGGHGSPEGAEGCKKPEGHENHTTHQHACEPAQDCPPPGHETHTTHEHPCQQGCAAPEGHARHTHQHACGEELPPPPPPKYDQTQAPKGDAGAQLDLKGEGLAAVFRAFAGDG